MKNLWHKLLKRIQPKVFIKITVMGTSAVDEPRNVPSYFYGLDEDEIRDIKLSVIIMTWRRFENLPEFTGF